MHLLCTAQGVKERKEGDISNERKGSNEPIMPVEEILATALSNESLPDLGRQLNMGAPMGSGMGSGRGSEERLDDRMGSLKAISRNMRQASVQDLEEQHQHMAAAQEQVPSPVIKAVSSALLLSCAAISQTVWHGPYALSSCALSAVKQDICLFSRRIWAAPSTGSLAALEKLL